MGVELEPTNYYLQQVIAEKFQRATTLDQSFVDFDSVRYHLSTPTRKSHLLLSMDVPCWAQLAQYGARQVLEREYAHRLVAESETEPGYSVSLEIDLEDPELVGNPQAQADLIEAVSLLKRNALAAPFERAFDLQRQIEAQPGDGLAKDPRTEIMSVHYRPEEAIYLLPAADRVTVIFSTIFKEETDRILGKVFLQEFVDARRRPSCQTAPQVLYSIREPPLELRHLPDLDTTERAGYVTFGAFIFSAVFSGRVLTLLHQSCSRGTRCPKSQPPPSPRSKCSATTSTTTSSAPVRSRPFACFEVAWG
jgi:actin related protein 2/3 complex subunit 2